MIFLESINEANPDSDDAFLRPGFLSVCRFSLPLLGFNKTEAFSLSAPKGAYAFSRSLDCVSGKKF